MKKRILAVAVLVICVAIAATGSLAYFTATGTARNVITSGGIDIQIVETTDTGRPFVDLTGVMPGATVSKIVKVENTGSGEAWIRVKVEPSITGVDGQSLPGTLNSGDSVMSFDIGSDWIDGEDGYYYYKSPVAPKGLTGALLEEVTFAAKMGNEYQNCNAQILISAQAVQSANNGTKVTEAKGWPET